MMDYGEDNMKMKKSYLDYVEALEEERKKILVFQRELPLCLHLVNQAIENCKQQVNYSLRSECEEEQTRSTESPFLEEFIPLKRSLSSEEEQSSKQQPHEDKKKKKKNVDWMRSVQLWNQTSPSPPDHVDVYPPPSKQQGGLVIESKKSGGAFHPFHKHKHKHKTNTSIINTAAAAATKSVSPHPSAVATAAATSSTCYNSNKSREDKDAQGNRKARRRCWSPELHKRFVQALQLLGGSHVATPKQIRELMKVDGLTNDEVKSHLQKYRLHTRRPAPSLRSNGNSQPTQFVVVGGIWVPPPEYSAAAASKGDTTTPATPPKGVFVPVATPPQLPLTSCSQQQNQNQLQQPQQRSPVGSRSSQHSVGDDNTHSDSPALTSSSTDTTTASPAF